MSDDHEWRAARDMAHLTEHAGARQPCCEPILARLSAIDPKHVRVLQFAYFRRSSAWLESADLGLAIGREFCGDAKRRAASETPGPLRADVADVLRFEGDALRRAAEAAYEGRALDPPRPSPRHGHDRTRERAVYFVRGEGTGLIKIGVADDVAARLANLATASPVPLTLLATVPGNAAIERFLHQQFAHLRAHGEWFREAPHLLAYIESAKARRPAATNSEGSPPKST